MSVISLDKYWNVLIMYHCSLFIRLYKAFNGKLPQNKLTKENVAKWNNDEWFYNASSHKHRKTNGRKLPSIKVQNMSLNKIMTNIFLMVSDTYGKNNKFWSSMKLGVLTRKTDKSEHIL